jgi:iron transport multicopper oxidase
MYNVDTPDTVITLADWYHSTSRNHRPLDYPDSTLINGFGRAWPTNTTAVRNTTLSVVSAAQGLSYRLRIVSISCQPAFTFSIDGHTLTIIEADGTLHQPYTVDSMTIYAGQRYSAILTANQAINNYWIRALPVIDGLVFPDPFVSGINSAILRYNGAPLIDPTTTSTAGSNPMVESRLVPRTSAAAPGTPRLSAPDVYALNLDFTLDIAAFQYALNGVETKLPSVPVLLQILSGSQSVQNMIPSRLVPRRLGAGHAEADII